jgi:hypothetical protein
MSEEEFEALNRLKKFWSEEARFFSNKGKEDREKWIVLEFLSVLDVDFNETELEPVDQEDDRKVDIRFRDALFQIKEVTDPNTRITRDTKEFNNAIQNATSLDDVKYEGHIYDVSPVVQEYDLLFKKAREEAEKKYINTKDKLDLLIYTTRTRTGLIQPNEINQAALSELGWRSISCLNAKQAVVLFSTERAPKFLYERSGQIKRNLR